MRDPQNDRGDGARWRCSPSPPSSVAGGGLPGGTPQARAADPVVLTVTGNGQTKTFTMAELKALPDVHRLLRASMNSAGTVTPPEPGQGRQAHRRPRFGRAA